MAAGTASISSRQGLSTSSKAAAGSPLDRLRTLGQRRDEGASHDISPVCPLCGPRQSRTYLMSGTNRDPLEVGDLFRGGGEYLEPSINPNQRLDRPNEARRPNEGPSDAVKIPVHYEGALTWISAST
jgi:hypothetical protein